MLIAEDFNIQNEGLDTVMKRMNGYIVNRFYEISQMILKRKYALAVSIGILCVKYIQIRINDHVGITYHYCNK